MTHALADLGPRVDTASHAPSTATPSSSGAAFAEAVDAAVGRAQRESHHRGARAETPARSADRPGNRDEPASPDAADDAAHHGDRSGEVRGGGHHHGHDRDDDHRGTQGAKDEALQLMWTVVPHTLPTAAAVGVAHRHAAESPSKVVGVGPSGVGPVDAAAAQHSTRFHFSHDARLGAPADPHAAAAEAKPGPLTMAGGATTRTLAAAASASSTAAGLSNTSGHLAGANTPAQSRELLLSQQNGAADSGATPAARAGRTGLGADVGAPDGAARASSAATASAAAAPSTTASSVASASAAAPSTTTTSLESARLSNTSGHLAGANTPAQSRELLLSQRGGTATAEAGTASKTGRGAGAPHVAATSGAAGTGPDPANASAQAVPPTAVHVPTVTGSTLNSTPVATAPPVPTPTTPLAQPDVANILAQLRGAADGSYQLRARVHPAELGAVSITATVQGGALHVLLSPDPTAQQAISQSLPQLRAYLADQGFTGVDVGLGSPQQSPGRNGQGEHGDRGAHTQGSDHTVGTGRVDAIDSVEGGTRTSRHRTGSSSALDRML